MSAADGERSANGTMARAPAGSARGWSAPTPAADAPADHETSHAEALARGLRALIDAAEGELPAVSLRAAIAASGARGGSFWRASGGELQCVLAEGRDAEALAGRAVPTEELLGADAPTALTTGLRASLGAAPFAALRVVRDADATPFTRADAARLAALGEGAAGAFVHAARVRAADRGGDLTLLAEMGREIASTLDLDRVLQVAVNLAARAITFDRGALALYEQGACDVRALAGTDAVDRDDPALKDLAARGAWAAGTGEAFYVSDREDPGSDAERIFLQLFGEDLAAAGVGSALYLPMRDEAGVVGVLVLEASRPEFADARQREIAGILAAQATVAIRNAQLYQQVPLAAVLGAVNARRKALLELPRRRRALVTVLAIAAVAALTLVRWPLRVPGEHAVLRPLDGLVARALVDGVVERVLVREGTTVARGMPLARLRDAELRARADAARADAEADERAAASAASRGDAGRERLLLMRATSFRRDAALADEQLRDVAIRAPVAGVVLTARPEQLVGARVAAGDAVLAVGRSDTLELELGVRQDDVARVRPGQEVRLRVDALPQRSFVGRVATLAPMPVDSAGVSAFPVRALVANPDGLLRPGMAVHARVLTDPASLAGRLLRRPVRAAQLLGWRMWP